MSEQLTDLCQSKNVQAYFDNELLPMTHDLMKSHIATCRTCSAELQALGQLKELFNLAFGLTSDLTLVLQKYSLASH